MASRQSSDNGCGAGEQVYNQFDDILLLSEGSLVFHGPREEVRSLLEHGISKQILGIATHI